MTKVAVHRRKNLVQLSRTNRNVTYTHYLSTSTATALDPRSRHNRVLSSVDDIPVKEIIDKYPEYIITIIQTLPFIMTSAASLYTHITVCYDFGIHSFLDY